MDELMIYNRQVRVSVPDWSGGRYDVERDIHTILRSGLRDFEYTDDIDVLSTFHEGVQYVRVIDGAFTYESENGLIVSATRS